MSLKRWNVMVAVLLWSGCGLAQQSPAAKPAGKAGKLCVAAVGNGSLKPIFVNEVQDELAKKLTAAGLNAEATSTASLVAKSLEMSGNNQDSMRLRKCAFMLLTAVDSPGPNAKASADSVILSFALFRKNAKKALVDGAIEAPAADTPTHAILTALEKEVQQVRDALAKR